MDAHFVFGEFAVRFFEVGVLLVDLREELFDTNGERLQLGFFDQNRDRALFLIGLKIKDALARAANGICGDVITWIYVKFETGHV